MTLLTLLYAPGAHRFTNVPSHCERMRACAGACQFCQRAQHVGRLHDFKTLKAAEACCSTIPPGPATQGAQMEKMEGCYPVYSQHQHQQQKCRAAPHDRGAEPHRTPRCPVRVRAAAPQAGWEARNPRPPPCVLDAWTRTDGGCSRRGSAAAATAVADLVALLRAQLRRRNEEDMARGLPSLR